ncbi:hypothetical protein QBC35DRAFT_140048 [Podospora australis]|uniref:Rhodopsin domain-containing protein n=1 Tax=Podospora australis TaxID=1536484 RepID=A0AAN7AEC6_9PEZI|nr:hypothetical protein QBC35DRAFT_140048 [Podospora australis]
MSDTTQPPPSDSPLPSDVPAGPPPPGAPPLLPPDLPHDSLKINIIVAATVCWFIAALFVALRFYTRGVVIKVIGGSDWSILVALIFAGATCGGLVEQCIHGSGRHIWDLNPADVPSAIAWGRAAWYGILFYLLTLLFSKVSILLLYIHLFTFKWARLAGQILLGIVILTHMFMAVATFTACIPLNSYWDFTVKKNYCHPQSIWWSNTGMHMVTDFLIFLLPMPVVWSIQLPRRQKFALSAVFGFGFLVCFISILRLLQLIKVQTEMDFTYAATELSYLTAVEVNGAIVCACVMTLKPFVAKFFPRLLSSRATGSNPSYGSSRHNRRPSDTYPVRGRDMYGRYWGRDDAPPTIGSRPFKGGGLHSPTLSSPLSSPLDKQYGILDESDTKRRSWLDGAIGGTPGYLRDRYVEIDDQYNTDERRRDDNKWGVDVELAENVTSPRATLAPREQARRDYMLRRGQPVPEGVVRVETRVTVTEEVTK